MLVVRSVFITQSKETGGAGTHTGHTRDTRAHKGTRITQTNLTTFITRFGMKFRSTSSAWTLLGDLLDRAPKTHMAPDGPMKTSTDIDMAALLKATVECDGSTTSLHEVLAAGTGDRTLMLFVRNGA